MRTTPNFAKLSLLGLFALTPTLARADAVYANMDIYAAGQTSAFANSQGGGVLPDSFTVTGDAALQFAVTGTVTMNNGGNYNNADGLGSAVAASSNTGYGSLSGITAPGAGYLVGVFVGSGGPSGTAPSSLDFTTLGTNFNSLNPVLDQVFFIGDGLTGNGTGSVQTFVVPNGATTLYLGISDACGYNGAPGCYYDNTGSFLTVDTVVTAPATPEPSSLLLLATGVLGLAGAAAHRGRLLAAVLPRA